MEAASRAQNSVSTSVRAGKFDGSLDALAARAPEIGFAEATTGEFAKARGKLARTAQLRGWRCVDWL